MIKQLTLNPATSSFWMRLIMERKHQTRDSFNKYLSNGSHELCALFGVQRIQQWIKQSLAWRTSESRRAKKHVNGNWQGKAILARREVRSGCCGSTWAEHHSWPWRVRVTSQRRGWLPRSTIASMDPWTSLMTTSHASDIQAAQNKKGKHLPRLYAFACSYFDLWRETRPWAKIHQAGTLIASPSHQKGVCLKGAPIVTNSSVPISDLR